MIPRRSGIRLLVPALFAFGAIGTVQPASAIALNGNDYSWPQCSSALGGGAPLPTNRTGFHILGLTNGIAFTRNPCLAGQWNFARAHTNRIGVYTMATYPTAAQITASKNGRYGNCSNSDLPCLLRNNGYAQARYAIATLRSIAKTVPMIWIDVESRSRQPWTSNKVANTYVIQGIVAGIQEAHLRPGIYSNIYFWNSISGWRTTLPEWYPNSHDGDMSAACSLTFAGGKVEIAQSTPENYDLDVTCPAAAGHLSSIFTSVTPPKATAGFTRVTSKGLEWHLTNDNHTSAFAFIYGSATDTPVTGDWNGDGIADVGFVRAVGDRLDWHLSTNKKTSSIWFTFGQTSRGYIPIVGDWDGDGRATAGLIRHVSNNVEWHVTNDNSTSGVFSFGTLARDAAVTGDWNQNLTFTAGFARATSKGLEWHLSNDNTNGALAFVYGIGTDTPIAGDWNGDAVTTAGLTRGVSGALEWHLTNNNRTGALAFTYGAATDHPVAGDWDGR